MKRTFQEDKNIIGIPRTVAVLRNSDFGGTDGLPHGQFNEGCIVIGDSGRIRLYFCIKGIRP